MSNKKRRTRKLHPGERRRSASITTGQGAKEYNGDTIALLERLVPRTTFIFPFGKPDETDMDRLSRARAFANALKTPHAAVVRNDSLGTRYFRELVLGSAHELHFMYTNVQHIDADQPCPYNTCIVVFKPGHADRVENGLCCVYWEPASTREEGLRQSA